MSSPAPADSDKPVHVGPLHGSARDRQVRVDCPHQRPPVAARGCASNEEFIAFVARMRPDLELTVGDSRYIDWADGRPWEWSGS